MIPKASNSQQPGTPVAIAVLGDPKLLTFLMYQGEGKGEKVPTVKPLTYYQKSGMLIILDPRDEYLNEKGMYWKHRADLVDPKEGVSISLMFRVVRVEENVDPVTGFVVDPVVPGGAGQKRKQFNNFSTYRLRKDRSFCHTNSSKNFRKSHTGSIYFIGVSTKCTNR